MNRQGEGVAFDFTIEKADLGGEVTVRFEYTVSTNYADDDIGIFIFNKDTPGLITPLGKDVKDGSGIFTVSFTADAVDDDYRLIFHIASVNALAYDFTFDNVKVRKFDPESLGTHGDGRKLNLVSVNITMTGSTCGIDNEYGDWIASTTRTLLGRCNIVIKTGVFSSTPTCICTSASTADVMRCTFFPSLPTATLITTLLDDAINQTFDKTLHLMCHGPIN